MTSTFPSLYDQSDVLGEQQSDENVDFFLDSGNYCKHTLAQISFLVFQSCLEGHAETDQADLSQVPETPEAKESEASGIEETVAGSSAVLCIICQAVINPEEGFDPR